MQPETREILQCVYAPRTPSLDAETGQPTSAKLPEEEKLQNTFAKQALLSAAFDNPKIVDLVLQNMPADLANHKTLSSAAQALYTRSPGVIAQMLAPIPLDDIVAFARAAIIARDQLVKNSKQTAKGKNGKNGSKEPAGGKPDQADDETFELQNLALTTFDPDSRMSLIDILRDAAVVDPVGFLHLERLHFTPIAYRRGDLVYAITMLPGEITRLTHREWSRTEKEFISLVAETIENQREEAVAEKSELTDSTTNQRDHTMAFSASLSASGTYGFVSFAANAGLQLNEQVRNSQEISRRQTREVTRKATTRAKREHKITFRTSSTFESEDTSFRELKNESSDAIRWDFHRVMTEWEVKLYRYGLRLTYDVTIPEPGSYLLRLHREIAQLDEQIARPVNPLPIEQVTPENYAALQSRYGILLEPPPAPIAMNASATTTYGGQNDTRVANTITLAVPDGYEIDPLSVNPDTPLDAKKGWRDGEPDVWTSRTDMRITENRNRLQLGPVTGQFPWQFTVFWFSDPRNGAQAIASVGYRVRPLPATLSAWRTRVYNILLEALRARHEESIQELSRHRDVLMEQVNSPDALHLRRMEREEIMKGVLRWILGPSFRFYNEELPQNLIQLQGELTDPGVDEVRRGFYSSTTNAVADEMVWRATLRHGQLINYLHQAIEWENVNFILYPYFWSEPTRWNFKQSLAHADSTHLEFLRSGAARVVVTIRPGFEKSWLNLVASGDLALAEGPAAPYLRIAEQIKAASEQYQPRTAGVQNLDEPGLLIDEWREWVPTGAIDVVRGSTLT
jgi:hypothetical protein